MCAVQYRGDTIVFLHPDRLAAQGCAALAAFLAATASELRPWLERQGYDVGGRPTFQLGCYPGGGARYVRHRCGSWPLPILQDGAYCGLLVPKLEPNLRSWAY